MQKIHKSAMQKYFRDFMLELFLLIYFFTMILQKNKSLKNLLLFCTIRSFVTPSTKLYLLWSFCHLERWQKEGERVKKIYVKYENVISTPFFSSIVSKSIKMYQYSINVVEFCGEKRGGCVLG